jgi:plasmid replication initiation protein
MKNSELIESKKLIVSQANDLVGAAYKMTLQEKRLLLLVISLIRREDDCFKRYFLPIQDIQEYLELNDKDIYTRIRQIIKKLMSRVIVFEDPRKGTIPIEEEAWTMFQWVSECRFIPAGRAPYGGAGVSIKLHEELKGWLLKLKKNFASVPFKEIARMPSYGSIRMFEILYHESLSLNKSTVIIRLDDLKRRLGVEDKYANFKDFRKIILERAQRDCQEKSPLSFKYEPLKRFGKKIVALKFTVWANQKLEEKDTKLPEIMKIPINLEPLTPEDKLEHEMNLAGYTGELWKYIETDGLELTRASFELAVKEMDELKSMRKEVKNPGGFIHKKLESRAGKTWLLEKQKKEESQRIQEERKKSQKMEQMQIEAQDKLIRKYIEECRKNENSWQKLIKEFEEQELPNLPDMIQNKYRQAGVDDPAIRLFFESSIAEKFLNPKKESEENE